MATTIHSRIVPVRHNAPSNTASTANATCVANSRRRLSTRSTTRPPYGASNSTGSVCIATTRPSAVPEPVSSSTSHDCAIDCIQVPVSDTVCPAKNRR